MFLTKQEEIILGGGEGAVPAKCMQLLVKLGEIYGADKMISVSSCQAAGVSYKSIGDPGLEFLKGFVEEGAKVKVPTFLNPAGMDMECWKSMDVKPEFASKQKEIIDAFGKMGIITTCSCTPYLFGNLPRFSEHIAWSESSAISFANSVIGARTNRESGFSALASAITGKTPNYGLHLEANRNPEITIDVRVDLKDMADFGAIGYFVGKSVKNKTPIFSGIKDCKIEDLKNLGAAMAAAGSVALYHIKGITPEAGKFEPSSVHEKISFGKEELEKSYGELSDCDKPDIIVVGCPHASIVELEEIAKLVRGKKLKTEFWICTSRAMKTWSDKMGFTEDFVSAGAKLVCDTCMVVSPLEETEYKCIGTNSGKAAKYIPGFCKKKVYFAPLKKLVEKAL